MASEAKPRPNRLVAWLLSRRVLRRLATLAALAVLAACAGAAYGYVRHNQPVTLPPPTGPYAVGRAGFDWVDTSRRDPLGRDPNAPRELMVWAWYPAAASGRPASYYPDAWRQALERSRGPGAVFLQQNLAQVRDHASADAPLAPASVPYPVVIMQPGLGPDAIDYTALAEDLASRGYVVFASTPTYSSNVVAFPDGRVVLGTARGNVPDTATPEQARSTLDPLIAVWAADNRFVIDQVQRLNAGDSTGRFTGRLDLRAIGVWGHSFGGASAAETCRLDARCQAAADLDGTPYGGVVEAGLTQPCLFIWSEPVDPAAPAEQETRYAAASLAGHSRGPIYQFTVRGMQHFNFTDNAVLYDPVLRPLGLLGPIDGRRGLQITGAYLAAFFDQYLRHQPQPLLAGPSAAYPEVQYAAP